MSQPVILLACRIFEGSIQNLLPAQNFQTVEFFDYGLHTFPKKLNSAVQNWLDSLPEPSRVILGYGLCGNGLANIQAGRHTLVIPKADDCIAILMGSRQRYRKEFDEHPGTYYLSKGWLEIGSDPLGQYETLLKKYDSETTNWLMDQQFQHYRRLVFVAQHVSEFDHYRIRIRQVAEYCSRWGMTYEEMLGSEEFIIQLLETANSMPRVADQFIIVQPGETLLPAYFTE